MRRSIPKRMPLFRRSCVAGVLLAIATSGGLVAPLQAQSPERALDQHVLRRWTSDVAVGGAIVDLATTPDGYLWLATGDGLKRFDGTRFVDYSSRTDTAIVANEILSLAVASNGELWVGTAAGLVRGGANGFRPVALPHMPNARIPALLTRGDTVWLAATSHGVVRWIDGTAVLYGAEAGLSAGQVHVLLPASDGGIWVGTGRGLIKLQGERFSRPAEVSGLAGADVRALAMHDGMLWIGTRTGLWRVARGRAEMVREPLFADAFIAALLSGPDGHLWIGTSGLGLMRRSPAGGIEQLMADGDVARYDVRALLRGPDGALFAATVGDGLLALLPGTVEPFTMAHGLPSDIALAVLADRDGSVWVGTFGGGLAHVRTDGVTTWDTSDGLPDATVMSLARTVEGLWIGTRRGLALLTGGAVHEVSDPLLQDAGVVAMHVDRRARLWLGTVRGLVVREAGTFRAITAADGLSADFVFAIHEARNNDVWVGTQGGGITILRSGGGVDTLRVADGLGSDVVTAFFEDREGAMWAATAAGLSRITASGIVTLTQRHGLPDESLHALVEDDAGNVWMSSNHGLARVPWTELRQVADGSRADLDPLVLSAADGMPSTEANGGVQPPVARTPDGRLWFPTMKGIAVVDPASIESSDGGIRSRVEQMLVANEPVTSADASTLPPRTDYISFTYTGFDYGAAEDIRFRYRLQGYDEDWIEAGTQRVAQYTNLPPGSFEFQVQARRPHGQWGEADAFPVRIRPAFYQTPLFVLAMVLLVLGAALTLHRFRVRTLRWREAELLSVIAERDRADEQRELAEEQLRQSQKMEAIGRLAGGVAHDFNNLLTSIFGHVDLLRERCAADEVASSELEQLNWSADRAARLTRQLLTFSRPHEWSPVSVDLNGVVAGAEQLLRRAVSEAITLDIRLTADEIYVRADTVQLEQVLLNLVINARDATSPGGTITISTEAHAREVDDVLVHGALLTAADTGAGMSAATIARMYEPFFTTKAVGRGTGLGMPLVYGIVKRHEGKIDVESELGHGSTIRIWLPCVDPPATAAPPTTHAAPTAHVGPELAGIEHAGTEHVLLVEDEEPLRLLARRLLERTGYRVTAAATGKEALRLIGGDDNFDVLITDLIMPGTGGRDLATRIRELRPEIPILFMSGYSDDEDLVRAFAPPTDFLPKPFESDTLRTRLRQLLDSRRFPEART